MKRTHWELADWTQRQAFLEREVVFVVRVGGRQASEKVVAADEFVPTRDATIIFVAYPPGWQYKGRFARGRKPAAMYDLVARRHRRRRHHGWG
jgi:hypothetical protein